MAGNVGNEPCDSRLGVEGAWHADADRLDAFHVGDDRPCHAEQLANHALFAVARVGRQDSCLQKPWFDVPFNDGPLQIRPAYVKAEVTRHGAYSAADEPVLASRASADSGPRPADGHAAGDRKSVV